MESSCEWLMPYLKAPPAVIQAMKKVVSAGCLEDLQKTLQIERYSTSYGTFCIMYGSYQFFHVNGLFLEIFPLFLGQFSRRCGQVKRT